MGEGHNKALGYAFGCTTPVGWVPYPKEVPRRHALLDAVGRVDDPCDRPAYLAPKFAPTPKFKPPREGYPNNMCDLNDYADVREGQTNEGDGQPQLQIGIAEGTPAEMTLKVKLQPRFEESECYGSPGAMTEAPYQGENEGFGQGSMETTPGPQAVLESGMKRWAKCMSPCVPRLPPYSCRGLIKPPREDWLKVDPSSRCKPSFVSTRDPAPEDKVPLTGREFTEGKRTCDFYRIHPKLPKRLNNPEWFKGYGLEKQGHPFYLTTTRDYGLFPPTAHTMQTSYFPIECKFTDHLAKTGMPRNRSLNLTSNKSCV